ncbi:hypothetical protein NMK50_03100 [Bartonella harrusi]|uniref:Uncharacterized protein n=1 Tax=Bartonella harrusi TaxID=2961895 RepID=A0ABY5EWF4_9HYPH|nr:hypothetical protein [Bartonella harrusi]UTO29460.1 hypothetical protein NMK50_03100 [Bartonella harrusi]
MRSSPAGLISINSHPYFFAFLKARAIAGCVIVGGWCPMFIPLNLGTICPVA